MTVATKLCPHRVSVEAYCKKCADEAARPGATMDGKRQVGDGLQRNTGAAVTPFRQSADISLLDQFEQQLARVAGAAEAEQLWRMVSAADVAARMVRLHSDEQLRYGKLRLRAERRWGELLGPAEPGGNNHRVTGGNTGANRVAVHRARLVAEVPADVFTAYVEKTNDPETLRRSRLLRVAREKKAEQRRAEPTGPVPTGIDVRPGDFREVLADVEQADAVITDPPYAKEYRHLYAPLAEFAARVLKPDGTLVVLCGTRPDAWLRLLPGMEQHLPLRWVGCYLTTGASWRDHQAGIATNWKPVLIFGGSRNLNTDVWRSSASDDKTHHRWGQDEAAFGKLVEAFTDPGQLVVDPFLGGGTTAVVCRDLERRFVGCDTDAAAVATTRTRLA